MGRGERRHLGDVVLFTFFLSLYLASFPPHPFPLHPLSLFSTSALSPFSPSPFSLLLSSLSLIPSSTFPPPLTLQSQQLRSTNSSQFWDFLCEVLELQDIQEQRRPLSDSQRVKFAKEIKGTCMYVYKLCSYCEVGNYNLTHLTDTPQQQDTHDITETSGSSNCPSVHLYTNYT